MVAYYRLKDVSQLKDLGFRLSEGVQVLSADLIAPVNEATRLLEDARTQARDIVRDAENVREAERRRGYEEGLAQGKMQAIELMLRQGVDLDRRIEALELELTNIVMVSMRKLVDGFDDAAKAEAVVRGALKQMRREKKAEIRVSPEQLNYFRTSVLRLQTDYPGFELIEIVEDATLAAPHVIVETSVGRIEGDLGSRLVEFDSIILGMLPGISPDDEALLTLDEKTIEPEQSIEAESPVKARKFSSEYRDLESSIFDIEEEDEDEDYEDDASYEEEDDEDEF